MNTQKNQSTLSKRKFGKSLRETVSHASQSDLIIDEKLRDPVKVIEEQNKERISWLIPERRTRMSRSPFSFFRGAARLMAYDLSKSTSTGINVQLCGDCHLSNFGGYASPERHLIFDINDFDETLPGPWEWDLKRLSTSFIIAGKHNSFKKKQTEKLALALIETYCRWIQKYSKMKVLEIWYDLISLDDLVEEPKAKKFKSTTKKIVDKAKRKDHLKMRDDLCETKKNTLRIKSDPPLVFPIRDIKDNKRKEELTKAIHDSFEDYKKNINGEIQFLINQFTPIDIALKVVGVGSVGNLCAILLLVGNNEEDPIFLQIKQANQSVLEEFLPKSKYRNYGKRVVEGQKLIQTASDIFLGWTKSNDLGKQYYIRQLKDWKGSLDVEDATFDQLLLAAKLRGKVLANAHARSGNSKVIAGYIGKGKEIQKSILEFSKKYSKQNLKDYRAFIEMINSGELLVNQN